jgi:hypothetical protein
MGYTSSCVDPDVYICKSVKNDGSQYYEMVLCYVDDILIVFRQPLDTTNELKGTFKLKGDKVSTRYVSWCMIASQDHEWCSMLDYNIK